ncbi:MAG: methyl-viologen-reducing hydrogenase subunit delta [Comamonadaceae bacterium]|nr:methyl-viologen-reducing hydrogenase subunit delta [Comamonadaceae bacterium]
MQALRNTRLAGLAVYVRVERLFDAAFGAARNPLRHLGATGFMLFWWLALSGIYLYAVLDTSVAGAHRSIQALSQGPWAVGGVLRSLHRYSADAFVLVMGLHLLREGLHGRYHGFRRHPWLTGVPLLPLVFVCAVGGFWLNWDQLGQFSAVASAEWLDRLPLMASSISRNFISAAAVNDRLFSLFVFIHLGVPLLLVFGLWFHIQRLSHAQVFPPRPVALGTSGVLLALALALPVLSHPPADMAVVPTVLAYDWLLLFIHPLAAAFSNDTLWLLLALVLLTLLVLPFMPQPAPPPVAQVDPAHCSGCRRCMADCPYAAITMAPHPYERLGRLGRETAVVDADLCASCGICVGACPSSTPFRSVARLVTGIDLPQAPIGELRHRLQRQLAVMTSGRRIVVFGCDHGARVAALAAPDVAPFSLACVGMLPPSFVEYALRDGADGVLISGCAEGACEFRLGQRWSAERLAGAREPHLRAHIPAAQWATAWADASDEDGLRAALQQLRRQLDEHVARPSRLEAESA